MKPTAHRVLGLWREQTALAPTFAEVRDGLGLRRFQGPELRTVLDNLVSQGLLRHERKHYTLVDPAHIAEQAPPAIRPRVPEGQLGVFAANPRGFGFVEIAGEPRALFIPPRNIGGALDGDWVRVELAPQRGRSRPSGLVKQVVRRRHATLRARLIEDEGEWFAAPMNERVPWIYLEGVDAKAPPQPDSLLEVEITAYPSAWDEAPEGRILREFGSETFGPREVVLHILADTDLSADFSAEARAESEALSQAPAPRATRGRKDLRSLPLVTIDPPDARDFDDAVCAEPLKSGGWRLWVAIADVAEYVTPGSGLDRDAYAKGTSVYFPDQVFHMLPESISAGLCTIAPNEDRYALVCEMEIDAQGRRQGYKLHEALIHSHARFTYAQVQQLFEEGKSPDVPAKHTAMLLSLRKVAAALRVMRQERGALDFAFPEYRFQLDDAGMPEAVREVYATEATRLVEQCMLEANESVAEFCVQNELPVPYRVHDPPPPESRAPLAQTLWNLGLEVAESVLTAPDGIRRVLDKAQNHPRREAVELAVLKSLSQAQYRLRNDGHFALAASHYTHFTSPIRRYPDLLVHRALKLHLRRGKGQGSKPMALAPEDGLHMSTRERIAAEAEGRVVRLYKVLYMEPHLGSSFDATVGNVSERGLFVRLREHPVDGMLPLDAIPGPAPRHDRERNELVTRGKQPNIAAGDQLTVVLARADRLSQKLEFAFARWGWAEGGDEGQGRDKAAGKPGSKAERQGAGKTAGKKEGKKEGKGSSRPKASGKTEAKPKSKSGGEGKPRGKGKSKGGGR